MKLYISYRSSASARVRMALSLKKIPYETVAIQSDKGRFNSPEYLKLNPQGLVPALEHDGRVLVQSVAILEYLEEVYPEHPLLPKDPFARARVRALTNIVTSDIQPLENTGTIRYLREHLKHDEATQIEWFNYWIAKGFQALEKQLASSPETGRFSHGDNVTIADIALVPQVSNAFRHGLDMTPFPTIKRIYEAAIALPAVQGALPQNPQ